MAILRNDTTVRSADGQTTSPIITAANIGNYGISTTSTYYIGTTQNVFNRASGAQTLTGVSIDGNAANITAYTINQNVGTSNTPSFAGLVSSAVTNYAFLQVTDTNNFWITPGNNNWGLYFETSAGGLLGGTGDSNRLGFVGAGAARFYVDLNNGNGWFGGSLTANTDSRAPIFYDSANTAYYLDPANTGTSLLVAGNVGIGNTSPSAKLHVLGASYTTASAANNNVRFEGGGGNGLGFGTIDATSTYASWIQSGYVPNFATATYALLLNPLGGNVGIGTTSPTHKLHVYARGNGAGVLIESDPTDNANQAPALKLYPKSTDASERNWSISPFRNYAQSLSISSSDSKGGDPYSNATTRLIIDGINGNVGIGTISPSQKLHVVGTGFASTDFRAPIFYDSDNTAYYIDAASTSVLNKINLNSAGVASIQWRAAGVGTITSGFPFYNNASYGSINIEVSDNDTGGLVIDNEGVTVYGAADNGQLFRTIDEDVYQTNGNNITAATTFWINQGADGGGTIRGSFTSTGDFRAPIFYDSNDTNYYSDPAGLNRFNALNIGNQGALTGNTTYALGAYHNSRYMVGLRYSSGGAAYPWLVHDSWNGSAFIIHFNGVGDRFHISESGIAYVTGDFRAPIFYDSNNTAYYLDPASTSNLNTVTVNDVLTYGVVAAKSFSVSVNTSTYWTVVRPNGSSIATGYIYRITLCTTGTGTDTGEQYLLANVDSAGWVVKAVTKTGSGSNWPYVFLDAGVPKVKTDHASLYTVTVLVEELNSGNTGGLPSVFGLAGLFTSDNGTPKYRAGWFSSDNTLLHSGNYGSYSTFSGSVTSTYGNFTSPGLIIGDAQYGFYVVSGNVYYKSGSGGVHYWRNIANSADIMSLNNSGALTLTGDVRALVFYDSANTSYYCDPNGVSNLYGVAIRGDVAATNTDNQIFFWGTGNTTTSAIGFKSNGGAFSNPTGAGDGYNTYLTMDTDGRGWVFRRGTGGTDFTAAYTSGWILNNGVWQANASMRSPIFYDSNNTSYYLDAANSGTSLLVAGNVGIGTTSPSYKLQVVGSFAATTKSFNIEHPTKPNARLIYGSLESPYHGIRLTGKGTLINGSCKVNLPDYIYKLVREESVSIHLTGVKCGKVLYVDEINVKENYFTVTYDKTMFENYKNYEFFWDFTAIRSDVPELITEA